jgi:hypothetical protein
MPSVTHAGALPSVTTGGLHLWLIVASLAATAGAPDGASANPIPAAANATAVPLKNEFRRLLSGELDQLPEGALGTAAEYEDGSDEAFLRRLWHELYGDEPVMPAAPA